MSLLSSFRAAPVVCSAIISLTAAPAPKASESVRLKQVADIPLPGAAVRFDYQSLDLAHHRLYIAHMGANQLVVFDTKTRTIAANLDGFPNVHGVWAVPELDRVYASTTGGHNVTVVDMTSLRTVARVGPVKYPDGLAFAPGPKRVFVSDEHGEADAVIDANTNSLVATIPMGGGVGNTVYDPGSKRILVAVQGRNELAVLDPATARIINRYPVRGIDHPHGVALDVSNRLAFVAGEANNRVAVMDLESMQVLMTAPVGNGPDVLAFDPGLKLLYVAAESGHVTILRENEKAMDTVATFVMPHAHTVCVDPETHLVYFPLQNIDGHPVLRIMVPIEVRSSDGLQSR
jgi:DNA-binding beta-propeller fold protein YncE